MSRMTVTDSLTDLSNNSGRSCSPRCREVSHASTHRLLSLATRERTSRSNGLSSVSSDRHPQDIRDIIVGWPKKETRGGQNQRALKHGSRHTTAPQHAKSTEGLRPAHADSAGLRLIMAEPCSGNHLQAFALLRPLRSIGRSCRASRRSVPAHGLRLADVRGRVEPTSGMRDRRHERRRSSRSCIRRARSRC